MITFGLSFTDLKFSIVEDIWRKLCPSISSTMHPKDSNFAFRSPLDEVKSTQLSD